MIMTSLNFILNVLMIKIRGVRTYELYFSPKIIRQSLHFSKKGKYIPISRMSPNHVQSGRSPGVIFSKKCTNPFAFIQ